MNSRKIEYYLLKSCILLFKLIGLRASRWIGRVLGFIFYSIIPIRKDVVIKNLQKAFPEKSLEEIKKIAYRNIQNSIITFIEFFYVSSLSEKRLLDLCYVDDNFFDLPRKIKEQNKGAIYLTGHFGNWEVAAMWVGLQIRQKLDLELKVLVKPQSNPYITEIVKNARQHFGNVSVNTGSSIRDLFAIIKEKGVAAIVGDQRGPKELRRVKFFDQDTAIYPGTGAISLRTGAPILFMFFVREKSGIFKGAVEELSMENLPEDNDEKIHEITQRYMNLLEKYVRQYPDQYFWMHNLWKY